MKFKRGVAASSDYNAGKVPRVEIQLGKQQAQIEEALAVITGPINFNNTIISENITFAKDYNGFSVGNIIVESGIVRIPDGSAWVII